MQLLGARHQMNHPHSLVNPEKERQGIAKNAKKTARCPPPTVSGRAGDPLIQAQRFGLK